ncbi:hypothetical protein HMPREF9098_1862 [Kingella denitrificans ATCC 33394]|uniref:Uncharacterized protein n=1 Tax=Kingella denitrificans ATCC 33394 TaxID=888741 RepID=F0F177_9NEIS|nr:hypothetical protein HMPREF9098_1862 [Kingella denitrificans ATCC 33394]
MRDKFQTERRLFCLIRHNNCAKSKKPGQPNGQSKSSLHTIFQCAGCFRFIVR